MKLLYLIITTLIASHALGQDPNGLDKYTVDSLFLANNSEKKIVAFKYNDVIIYFSFADCKRALQKSIKYSKGGGPSDRRDLLKQSLKKIDKEIKQSDTANLSQTTFDKFQMTPLNAFAADEIDKGTCLILDSKNIMHKTIIRITGSYSEGTLNARGVKLYFLPGQKQSFIGTTVWVS